MKEQANNTRGNRVITHDGKTMTYTQWEQYLDLPRDTVHRRMKCGYPIKKALSKKNYGNK